MDGARRKANGRAGQGVGKGPGRPAGAHPSPHPPATVGRVLHSQTTSLRLPGFQAWRRYGSNMYCWAAAGGEGVAGEDRERANARVAVHG